MFQQPPQAPLQQPSHVTQHSPAPVQPASLPTSPQIVPDSTQQDPQVQQRPYTTAVSLSFPFYHRVMV